MKRAHTGVLAALIGVALLAITGTAAAEDDGDGGGPSVYPSSAQQVTSEGGSVRGWVDPNGRATSYRFEYGTTAAYGAQSASTSTTGSGSWRAVSAALTGLTPQTTYHYRLVASNSKGSANTSDQTFTTTAAAVVTPPNEPPAQPPSVGEPQPGTTVGATLGKGTVLVRARGSDEFVKLTASSSLAFGSEVDASRGSLSLTSVLPSGAPQTGAFGGGRFVVRHSRRGYVDLHLRGRVCPGGSRAARGSKASLASAAATRPARRLWGRDSGGRFRTHGKNSHATVRGTRWLVVDRCDGTFTRVTEGSVVVRDLVRHTRRVLRAGESYLARPPR